MMTEPTPTPKPMPPEVEPEGVKLRDLHDYAGLRKDIFDGIKDEVTKQYPYSYNGVRVELHNTHYADPPEYSIHEQKKAILEDKYLARRLRGTLKLYDENTNDLLDQKETSLMRVPYLTERGTFIHGGNEIVSSMQSRLVPGVYSRIQDNGGLETHFNSRTGTGPRFRVGFEPETAQYHIKVAQSNLHLYSLLHDLGVPDESLEKSWGKQILAINKKKYDTRVVDKAYERLVPKYLRQPDLAKDQKALIIEETLNKMQVAKRVVEKNLPNYFDRTKAASWNAQYEGIKAAEITLGDVFTPDYTPAELLSFIDEELINIKEADAVVPPCSMGEDSYTETKVNDNKPKTVEGFRASQVSGVDDDAIKMSSEDDDESFTPDLKPDQMTDSYNSIYGKYGPRLASMERWPDRWLNADLPDRGFLDWYEQYHAGRRTDDDSRQIKRWKSFKARHGASLKKNPTPRRGFALRNWGIDGTKLVDPDHAEALTQSMDTYKKKEWEKYILKSSFCDEFEKNASVKQGYIELFDEIIGEQDNAFQKAAEDVTFKNKLKAERARVAEPKSEEHADAGNYSKGHVSWKGLPITIENPKGTYRKGVCNGKPWKTKMCADYGYFKSTAGKDKDQVDVFIGDKHNSEIVFIVNQSDSKGGFDEHKVVICEDNAKDAKELYLSNYEKGWDRILSIGSYTIKEFKEWLNSGDTNKKANL